MTERLPQYIVADLRRKAGLDAVDAIRRAIALVDHVDDKADIAMAAATFAASFAMGANATKATMSSPERCVDSFLDKIRPILIVTARVGLEKPHG